MTYPPQDAITLEEAHQRLAKSMTERELQSNIIGLAHNLGYLVYHTWRSDHSEAGFPDLTMVRLLPTPRLVVAELKRQNVKAVTPAQRNWLEALAGSGADCYIWRPLDYLNGDIEAALK